MPTEAFSAWLPLVPRVQGCQRALGGDAGEADGHAQGCRHACQHARGRALLGAPCRPGHSLTQALQLRRLCAVRVAMHTPVARTAASCPLPPPAAVLLWSGLTQPQPLASHRRRKRGQPAAQRGRRQWHRGLGLGGGGRLRRPGPRGRCGAAVRCRRVRCLPPACRPAAAHACSPWPEPRAPRRPLLPPLPAAAFIGFILYKRKPRASAPAPSSKRSRTSSEPAPALTLKQEEFLGDGGGSGLTPRSSPGAPVAVAATAAMAVREPAAWRGRRGGCADCVAHTADLSGSARRLSPRRTPLLTQPPPLPPGLCRPPPRAPTARCA